MTQQNISQSEHIRILAQELLDDIELGRLKPETLLLKATRLARFVDEPETKEWLLYELQGYRNTQVGKKYMGLTGRWTDMSKNLGFWGPLAQIETTIESTKMELAGLRVPDLSYSASSSNPRESVVSVQPLKQPIETVISRAGALSISINTLGGVRSRVLALLHQFVSKVYYQVAFSGLAESIFESYKKEVDGLLSKHCVDVFERVPSINARLSEGDNEAISQALSTCRRIIDAFADAMYPPSVTPVELGGGNTLQVGPQHHQNRINTYVRLYCTSDSRRTRLRQTLKNLYDRVSTGVHNDVTSHEARTLFLETYLLLGEIIMLGQNRETGGTDREKGTGA